MYMNAFPGQQPGERYVSKKAHNDGSLQPAAKIVAVIKIGAHTSHGPAGRTVGKAGAGNCCIKLTIASPKALAAHHRDLEQDDPQTETDCCRVPTMWQ